MASIIRKQNGKISVLKLTFVALVTSIVVSLVFTVIGTVIGTKISQSFKDRIEEEDNNDIDTD